MRLRTLFFVAISLAALVGGLWYWRKAEETAARRRETWDYQQRIDATAALLDRELEWPQRSVPLADFAEIIAENAGLAVDIDRLAIEAERESLPKDPKSRDSLAGMRVEIPGGVLSVEAVLRLGLSQHELCYDVGERRLTITTPDASRDRTRQRTVVYPLPQPELASADVDEDAWVNLVTTLVDPAEWADVGGQGHCEAVPGGLVVVQTEHTHRQIRRLLDSLARLQSPPQSLAPVPISPTTPSPADADVWAILRKPAEIECLEEPLDATLADLGQRCGVPIHVDERKLSEAGVPPDVPVTCLLDGVSLAALLNRLLSDAELTFWVRDGAIEVTTPEVAESPDHMVAVAYPVHDLVGGPGMRDYDPLIDLISTTVAPETWGDVGGPGSIGQEFDGWLLVSQTWDVHEQIEQLLAQVRRALAYDEHPSVMGITAERPGERRIRETLDREMPLRFTDTPLDDAARQLSEKLGIPIQLSARKLEEIGVNVQTRVSCDLAPAPLRNQLRTLLAPLELAFITQNEVLLITTPDDAQSPQNMPVRIYDVRPLTDPDLGALDEDSLESGLTGLLVVHSWHDQGGPAGLQYFRGLAVINQTEEIHGKIERLLAAIEQHCLPGTTDDSNRPWIVKLENDPANERIEQLLGRPLEISFHGKTIHDAAEQLAQHAGISIVIDNDCLPATLAPTLPTVSLAQPGLTLAGILDRMLRPRGLSYTVADGRLLVEFAEAAGRRQDTRLYRVDDLAGRPGNTTSSIASQLAAQTDPEALNARPGTGSISLLGSQWIGVMATSRLHERVADLLAELRTGERPARARERGELAAEDAAMQELRIEREAEAFLKRSAQETNPTPTDPKADPFAP